MIVMSISVEYIIIFLYENIIFLYKILNSLFFQTLFFLRTILFICHPMFYNKKDKHIGRKNMITLRKIASGLVTYVILTFLLSIYSFKNNSFTLNYILLAISMAVATVLSYKAYKKNKKFKKYYKVLTFSIFSYFIGSLIDIFNVKSFPSSSSRIFYLICSISLFIAICNLIIYLSTKWD